MLHAKSVLPKFVVLHFFCIIWAVVWNSTRKFIESLLPRGLLKASVILWKFMLFLSKWRRELKLYNFETGEQWLRLHLGRALLCVRKLGISASEGTFRESWQRSDETPPVSISIRPREGEKCPIFLKGTAVQLVGQRLSKKKQHTTKERRQWREEEYCAISAVTGPFRSCGRPLDIVFATRILFRSFGPGEQGRGERTPKERKQHVERWSTAAISLTSAPNINHGIVYCENHKDLRISHFLAGKISLGLPLRAASFPLTHNSRIRHHRKKKFLAILNRTGADHAEHAFMLTTHWHQSTINMYQLFTTSWLPLTLASQPIKIGLIKF